MKILLLASLMFVGAIDLFAQQHRFADPTAKWSVLETEYGWMVPSYSSIVIFEVVGDTTLNDLSYQKINYNRSIFPLENNGLFYIRKDTSEKVFGRVNADSSDYLLYDFGKTAGDTFSVGLPGYWPYPVKIRVDSTATSFLGMSRKVMYVTTYAIQNDFNDIFVEGIGSLNSWFIYPGTPIFAIDAPSYLLQCYSDNDTVVYRRSLNYSCNNDTSVGWSIEKELWNNVIRVYPNPATDIVYVQTPVNQLSVTFNLTDVTGREILTELLIGDIIAIPVTTLSKGLYLYSIRSGSRKLSSGKLVLD